jgi:uncharacterized protein YndB with AHSA1/START domain
VISVEKSVYIEAPVERVWAALTDSQAIASWMGAGSVADLELQVGRPYAVFGGETTGRFARINPPHQLDYTWRQAEWKRQWADSIVHWELAPVGTGTQVRLVHEGFPNRPERDGHDKGWDDYWLGPMKAWLEG